LPPIGSFEIENSKPELDGAGKIVPLAEPVFGMAIGMTERFIPGNPATASLSAH
jgi:hypothetical protein